MTNIETIYENLTGVDIAQQQRIWDERGKGYYGEYLVFSEVYPHIAGTCKILMNIEIPNGQGKTTELDLLLIHETGFYVFEVKHYKGTIYGKGPDKNWTQYFRTTSNEHFYNPISQNRNHINALTKMFPGVPTHSYIVFTNPECVLKVTDVPEDVTVCGLRSVLSDITLRIKKRQAVLSMEDIDKVFGDLKKYSPMLEAPVPIDGTVYPLSGYIQALGQACQRFVAEKEAEFNQKTQKAKSRSVKIAVGVVAACLILSVTLITGAQRRISAAEDAMADFAQKFEHVEEFNDGNISFSDSLITVSDVVLEESSDIVNTVNFSCKLTPASSTYGITIEEDAVLIVILKDGSVKEYDLWNETYPYKRPVQVTGMVQVGLHEFYDIDLSDISYVKLANLGVWKHQQYKRNNVASGYEVELYSVK